MRKSLRMAILFIILLGYFIVSCTPEKVISPAKQVLVNTTTSSAVMKQGWEIEWEKVVEAAKKEGKVSVYNQWGATARIEIARAFKEKFGIDIEFTSVGKGTELVTKMENERRAGLFLADLIGTGNTTMLTEMKPAGFLAPIEPMLILPEVTDPKIRLGGRIFLDKQKLIIPLIAQFNSYVDRNTDLVKEGEIKSYHDLLDPRWKGKIMMGDPTVAGSGNSWVSFMTRLWGLDKTRDYLRQFVKQEPVISRDLRLLVEWLAKGKYQAGAALHPSTLMEFKKLGAPVAKVRVKEGGSLTSSSGSIALPSGQIPHPNATKVLINWLLTREGQTLFSKSIFMPSARIDVPVPEGLEDSVPLPGEPILVEDEEESLFKGKLMGIAREIVAPLMR